MAISLPQVVSAACGCVRLDSPHTGEGATLRAYMLAAVKPCPPQLFVLLVTERALTALAPVRLEDVLH